MSRSIVEAHGGTLERAPREPDTAARGTTFRLTLPFAETYEHGSDT